MHDKDMLLETRKLSLNIGGKNVLCEVSAHFFENQITAIIGPNGSGKSTLLSFLTRKRVVGETSGTDGEVLFRGKPLSDMSSQSFAKLAAVLPKFHHTILDFYVEDIVLMGRFPFKEKFQDYTAEDREKVRVAMEKAGVSHLALRKAGGLSGGELQRVMIARTLAQDTDLLFLDEPTNHLDVKHKLALMHLLRGCDKTVVAVLHDLSLVAQYTDYVVAMKDGKVYATGKTEEVLKPDILKEIFEVPFLRFEQAGKIYLNY